MPCYGHTHCCLCNIPICPDMPTTEILEGKNPKFDFTDDDDDVTPEQIKKFTDWSQFMVDNKEKLLWLYNGHALYQNGEIHEVGVNEDGDYGILCEKNNSSKYHVGLRCKITSAIFVHKYCFDLLNDHYANIPCNVGNKLTNIWWFLAVYNLGIDAPHIDDITSNYHFQSDLDQYSDTNWLLIDPTINNQNKERINQRYRQMLTLRNWDEPFQFRGYRLKV